ncbi:substrate-binding domain-containing protein [Mesorhizobium sp. B3-2-1]|uniref:substrate-binding domain-containing protein n=1 Tax=Mesorhizobium sp. B3-2-1 TaxID=2589891 RepID=UPI0011290C93|nr:substrate-binding domain-containing protein [Mesorhizobium sp. B3-2-1]TPI28257.1 substrate-binding domain-containing protein [Mesorhizobium sp. B3-2-1]
MPLTEPVKQAKAQGVFITTVDRGLAEEGIEDLYVGGNNPQYGVIAGQYFKKKFPGGAKIVVMRGIPTTIDNVRIEAFKKGTGEFEGPNPRHAIRELESGQGLRGDAGLPAEI